MNPGNETVAPKVSTLTKVSYATTLYGTKTNIGYVQSVSEFLTTPEEITYSAIDIEDERVAKGRRKATAVEIPWLYTESQWDELKAVEEANTPVYIFLQLPEETANTVNKPLTFYFQAKIAVGMDAIEIDNMLQSMVKLYRNSAISESKGYPVEPEPGE